MKNLIVFILLFSGIGLFGQSEKSQKNICEEKIEICFLIDATGSMRPAMEDLKSNIGIVLKNLKQNWSGWKIETGAVLYRDRGEEYLTREFEKTSNLKSFENFIKNQYAVGGGDAGEPLAVAMKKALNSQTWSGSRNPKLLLLLTDRDTQSTIDKFSKRLESQSIEIVSVNFRHEDITAFCGNTTGAEITEIISQKNSENPKAIDFPYLISEKINAFIFDQSCVFDKNPGSSQNAISVFPNPVSDAFSLQLPPGKWNVELQTTDAKIIEKRQLNGDENWAVNHLPGGTYFLNISDGQTTTTERLVIARK